SCASRELSNRETIVVFWYLSQQSFRSSYTIFAPAIETARMRTATAGFFVGYLAITLLIAPSLLCALGVARNYPVGVVMVLDRTGVLEPLQRVARQTEEFRDHVMWMADDYLSHRIIPHILTGQD